MRLRDLGLAVGRLEPGAANAVTDVPGVEVGHAPGGESGVTALIPFAGAPRRFFAGRWSLDGGDELIGGLAMTEDFGALSTPLVLAPPQAAGRIYDGLLTYGFQLDAGLPEDAGWPPGLIAVDGVPAPSASLHAALTEDHVAAALSAASAEPPGEGQAGVGRGLAAFGARAGIGTASRRLPAGSVVGVLLAANGGEPGALTVDGERVGPRLGLAPLAPERRRTFAAVIATDAPLLPVQLDRLAQRAAFGLVRVGLLDEHTSGGTILALSTTALRDDMPAGPGAVRAAATAESGLPELFAAAAESCEEAVLNALVAASEQPSLDGSPALPTERLRPGGAVSADGLGDARWRAGLRRRLLAWYRRHRRDLPWRRTADPYSIWVSEVMLQQTRVETARGYYERFLARYPTVEALAAAEEGEVLKAWEGMGYYSRARNLHRAARTVVGEHGGRLPGTYDGLLDLPGVGPYTAAAVSSIAFDRPHPVLDGNVTRLLCRLLRVEGDPRRAPVRARLIAAGEALMPRSRPGDFNQALMELGARVCTPANPSCGECPLRAHCRARAELDDPSVLPVRPERRPRLHLEVAAGLIRRGNRLLLAQRPPGGMLAGLWEFPGGKREAGESLPDCLRREVREELDIDIEVERPLAVVDHDYSHRSIRLHAFAARCLGGRVRALGCAAWAWVSPGGLDGYAMPRADRKIIARLGWEGRRRGHFRTEGWLGG